MRATDVIVDFSDATDNVIIQQKREENQVNCHSRVRGAGREKAKKKEQINQRQKKCERT